MNDTFLKIGMILFVLVILPYLVYDNFSKHPETIVISLIMIIGVAFWVYNDKKE